MWIRLEVGANSDPDLSEIDPASMNIWSQIFRLFLFGFENYLNANASAPF